MSDESSMRDDFEAAMTDVSDEEVTEVVETAEVEETNETVDEAPETQETVDEAPEMAAETNDTAVESTEETPASVEETPPKSLKAPMDWSPEQREDWSKVPTHLQEKITEREQHMAQAMQGMSEARATHDQLTKLSQSYAPVIAAEGATSPMQAIETLFQTTALLQNGSQQQKAEMMAELINHYGVDIGALDNTLVGQPQAPEQAQNSQMEQMLNQRLAPLDNMMQQMNQHQASQQQATQQAANVSVQEFSQKAEFLSDVRADMADLIDMAHKQGRDMQLPEAYQKACSLNPQIVSIMQKRHAQKELAGNNSNLASKREAASSLNGRMSGSGNAGDGGLSLHDTIAGAWDNQGRG